jgi:hypothetical protein
MLNVSAQGGSENSIEIQSILFKSLNSEISPNFDTALISQKIGKKVIQHHTFFLGINVWYRSLSKNRFRDTVVIADSFHDYFAKSFGLISNVFCSALFKLLNRIFFMPLRVKLLILFRRSMAVRLQLRITDAAS